MPREELLTIVFRELQQAFKIADRVAMLFNGKIVEEGTPEQFQRSTNPIVQQFIEGRAEGPLTQQESTEGGVPSVPSFTD